MSPESILESIGKIDSLPLLRKIQEGVAVRIGKLSLEESNRQSGYRPVGVDVEANPGKPAKG